MKKKLLSILLILLFAFFAVSAMAVVFPPSETGANAEPKILIGYRYVPGHDKAVFLKEILDYEMVKYLVVDIESPIETTYSLSQTQTFTSSATWNITTNFEAGFNFITFFANIATSINETMTASVTVQTGEQFIVGYQAPGLYRLSWYIPGRQYVIQCGAEKISTGADDGQFTIRNLGTITFPINNGLYFDADYLGAAQ